MVLDNDDIAKHIILDIGNEKAEPVLSPECCIYKVPEDLRKEKKDAYTPYLISIGPIHHNNEKLKPMEKQKLKYFEHFRQRLTNEGQQNLEKYTANIGEEELKIRSYYSERYPELDKKKFVRMILLDAVFIVELFVRKWIGRPEINDDYLFTKTWIKKSIERDLFLVENQIPFSILKGLYNLIPPHSQRTHSSFLQLSCNYFKTYDPYPQMSIDDINRYNILKQGWDDPKHFTDLMRYFFVPQHLIRDGDSAPVIKTATKLKGAGITFEPISEGCLLDVRFKKNTFMDWLRWLFCCTKSVRARLQIPKLIVDGSTESILRNLMAFEQCHYPDHHYICNYVALIDYLIHNEQDVDELVESKVIVHELGSDKDLAGLINILCKNVVVNSTCYASLSRELDAHYQNPINSTLAKLRLVYFQDLWRSTGTLVGIVFLAFAIASFYKTIKDLLKHNSFTMFR